MVLAVACSRSVLASIFQRSARRVGAEPAIQLWLCRASAWVGIILVAMAGKTFVFASRQRRGSGHIGRFAPVPFLAPPAYFGGES